MPRIKLALLCLALVNVGADLEVGPYAALQVDILRPVGALPPHISGLFEEPVAFQQVANGYYFVFDRRAHAIYMVDPERTAARKVVDVGQELFDQLDAPVTRVAALDCPVAYAPVLEEAILPGSADVLKAIRSVAAY